MLTSFADLERRWLSIGDWSRRADSICGSDEGGHVATVGLRDRYVLVLQWQGNAPAETSLWAGAPGESPGAAVMIGRYGFEGVRWVPVCSCGEQACADASFQFRGRFAVEDVPTLVETIESLKTVETKFGQAKFWRPDDSADFTPRVDWPDQQA